MKIEDSFLKLAKYCEDADFKGWDPYDGLNSRLFQAIPFVRDVPSDDWIASGNFYRHIGMYAYTAEALKAIEKLAAHPYESLEKLEQLTWLANGFPIHCIPCAGSSMGIDTEEDLVTVTNIIAEQEQYSR